MVPSTILLAVLWRERWGNYYYASLMPIISVEHETLTDKLNSSQFEVWGLPNDCYDYVMVDWCIVQLECQAILLQGSVRLV